MGIRRFLANRDGNVAIIFLGCLVPLLISIGAAVDYARLADARELMQHSLDATVLALSSEAPKLTSTQLNARAVQLFNVNFPSGKADNVSVSATFTQTNGAVIAASASGTVPMTFLNLAGIASETLSVTSKSAWSSKRLRVALALDNTGSMAYSGKMSALKTATNNLLAQLQSQSTTSGDIYVSIIPFNRDVNIGASNKDATWLYWDGTCINYSSSSCNYGDKLYPYGTDKSKWNGCITDRNKDLDISVSVPDVNNYKTKFYVDQYGSCLSTLTPMTNNWTTLNSAVTAMTSNGSTNQTIGLVWAWQSLQLTSPIAAPAKDSNYEYQDAIILLSDGDNTENRFGGNGSASSSAVDDRMSKVCTAAKAAGVTIYTVLVISGNASVLKSCASSSDDYFNASTANDIITAFGAIGDKLSALRIAQ
ncbi:TadE/TadG family type IV pilus assembly protein [Pleomorphomonas sp. PLEO]|uniref:TadE/TadG family type IV pilus assembly protein n=1 Tax=Pleomorphomonas sp. PLEO TaxID=3239306 RepID=UPI00351E319F